MTAPEIACLEAEAAYLGCLLRMPRGWAQIALTSVSDDDFADPRHRVVLSGIRHTINRGFDPDPVAVLGELRRLGLLPSFLDDKSAGVVLAEVHAAPPLPDNASFYFRIVAEHAFRRRVAEAAARLEQVAGTESLDGLTEVLRDEWDALRIHWERTMRYDVPPSEVDE